MAKVFHPNPQRLIKRGYEAVANVPVIYASNGRYLREFNRYLRERARLEWHPGGGADIPRGRTLANIAERLLNFVQWCEARGLDWRMLSYGDVLAYQDEQIRGKWSVNGTKLLPSTANERADEATSFLRWAETRDMRGPFDVKMFMNHGSKELGIGPRMVRTGRAKEDVISPLQAGFVLPEPEEIRVWLSSVRERRGYTKHIACKIVMNTGVRRKEIEAMTVERWPTAETIAHARRRRLYSVAMRLVVTKGDRPRTIRMPLELADEVRQWIDGKRKTYEYRYFLRHKKRTDRLLLSDHPEAHGRPLSAQTVYRCFSEVHPRPAHWSPHKGRHTFACFWVLNALSAEAARAGGLGAMSADWVNNRGKFWLKSLQRQFGHVSTTTTEEYLRWLVYACGLAELASGWHRYLDGSGE